VVENSQFNDAMKLEDIRREYTREGLSREQLDADPIAQFETWLGRALELKLKDDPTAMVLATVDADGNPSQRTVLLKGLDEEGLVFYTNLGSRKSMEIQENPKVCLLFSWLSLERQIIVYGEAEKLSLSEATRYFLTRPRSAQKAAWSSRQSSGIGSRKLLEQAFHEIGHRFREGEIPLPSFWGGYRVKPTAMEFWQGRANRLHDRFMYRRKEDDWDIERLQP
jgi:pyridoxamine 5'-phosphate oxidase